MQLTSTQPRSSAPKAIAIPNAESLAWNVWETSNLGPLWLRWSEQGLRAIDFASQKLELDPELRQPIPSEVETALQRYFAGEAETFAAVELDLIGTIFQKRVWKALREIPYGQVCSYGHIANVLGIPRGMRAVGLANGKNPVPIIVPCHRVIEHNGKLGGYSGGLDIKRYLLKLEGAQLRQDHVHAGQLGLFS